MKKIILFILLIFSVNIQSQVRLGYTLKGIQNEFKQYVQEFNNSILKIYDDDKRRQEQNDANLNLGFANSAYGKGV